MRLIKSLRARIFAAIFLLGIVPFVLVGLWSATLQRQAALRQHGAELERSAELLATQISTNLAQAQQTAASIAQHPTLISDDRAQIETLFSDQLNNTSNLYLRMALFDLNGEARAATVNISPGDTVADVASFQDTLDSGEQAWLFSNNASNGDFIIHIHTPVFVGDELKYVLGAAVPATELAAALNNTAIYAPSDRGYVLSGDGIVLQNAGQFAANDDDAQRSAREATVSEQIGHPLQADTTTYTHLGIEKIAGYAPLPSTLDWTVVVERDVPTSAGSTSRNWEVALFSLGTVGLLTTLAIMWAIRRTMQPLDGLVEAIEQPDADVMAAIGSQPPPIVESLAEKFAGLKGRSAELQTELTHLTERQQAFLLGSAETIFWVGKNGIILDYSSPQQRDLNQPVEEMVGTDFFTFVRHLDGGGVYSRMLYCFQKCHQLNEPQLLECELNIENRPTIFSVRFAPGGNDDVLVFFRNIDKRSRDAEQRLKFYRALQIGTDGIATLDGDLNITFANDPFVKLYGYWNADELIGRPFTAQYDDEHTVLIQQTGIPHAREVGEWQDDVVGIRHDGSTFPQRLTLALSEVGGSLICHIQDLTSSHNADKQLAQATQALEARHMQELEQLRAEHTLVAKNGQRQDQLWAKMGHRIRTPLNALMGMTEALSEEIFGPLNANQKRLVERANTSSEQLKELIDNVLDISRYDAGTLTLQTAPIAPEEMAQIALNTVKDTAAGKRILLQYQIDDRAQSVVVDGRRLVDVLVQLLRTALHFAPAGAQAGLDINPIQQDNLLEFLVWNTGPATLEKLAPILKQLPTELPDPITDLPDTLAVGLALSQRIATLHGGTLRVRRGSNNDNQYVITVPWKSGGQTATRSPDSPSLYNNQQIEISSLHSPTAPLILLAEDNEINIVTVADYLQFKGFRIMVARTGVEALSMAAKQTPDLVLMDIQMPEMDGLEATRRLRAQTATATIPIIALTGLAMPGDQKRCLEAGANDYLSKPVSLKNLVSVIGSYLSV